jgi:hypothetical protein
VFLQDVVVFISWRTAVARASSPARNFRGTEGTYLQAEDWRLAAPRGDSGTQLRSVQPGERTGLPQPSLLAASRCTLVSPSRQGKVELVGVNNCTARHLAGVKASPPRRPVGACGEAECLASGPGRFAPGERMCGPSFR